MNTLLPSKGYETQGTLRKSTTFSGFCNYTTRRKWSTFGVRPIIAQLHNPEKVVEFRSVPLCPIIAQLHNPEKVVDFRSVPYNRPVCPFQISLRKLPITLEPLGIV